jgi:prevent-host-death family protein
VTIEIPVSEARAQLSELINRVGYGKERIVLTRHGKPLVALVPAELVASGEQAQEPAGVLLDLSARSDPYARPFGMAAQHDDGPRA